MNIRWFLIFDPLTRAEEGELLLMLREQPNPPPLLVVQDGELRSLNISQ